jgi:hypothetical protein
MFLYIYKISNIKYEDLLSNDSEEIIINKDNVKNNDNIDEIKGKVKTKKDLIPFIFRLKSNFLFIDTNRKSLKRKALDILYNAFNTIDIFDPSYEKERKLICEADNKQIKFLHENNIEYNDELTTEYCEGDIEEDYYFYEAKISFNINNKVIEFLYYGDSIKIMHERNQNELNFILNKFESIMA